MFTTSAPTTSSMPLYQRPQTIVAAPPPPLTHAVATIPQHPSYRAPTDRIFYLAHMCQPTCLNRVRPVKQDMHLGKNPLLTPLLYDFRRMTSRRKVNRKVNINSNTTEDHKTLKYITCLIKFVFNNLFHSRPLLRFLSM